MSEHKNPEPLYVKPKYITYGGDSNRQVSNTPRHQLQCTPEEEAEALELAKSQEARTKYNRREGALMRRNLDPMWIENTRVLMKMFKQCGNDLSVAVMNFRKWKHANGWDCSERYVFALMQYVREKLAISGQTESMLEEQAQDLREMRDKALTDLGTGKYEPLMEVVRLKNQTFNLPKYYRDMQKTSGVTVNINNQSNTQNVTVTKNRLEDYLAKIPEKDREAVKRLAGEFRKDGSIPQSIDMVGNKEIENAEEKNS